MTLPADIRDEPGLKQGDALLVERDGRKIVLVRPDDLAEQLDGSLSEPLEWDPDAI